MCDDVVQRNLYSLQFLSDWFVIEEQIRTWDDEDQYYDDDELIEKCDGYYKRKAQKSKIKEKLLLVAWHPDCVKDWSISEDEKGSWK